MSALALPPLALYVHMPWCVRKCPYCDFNSHAIGKELPEREYVAALLDDLEQDLDAAQGRTLVSIFFGGGTPSLFSPESIAEILSGVRERVSCAPDIEITLEANPGTIEHGRFGGYKAAGVTRISLGAQTFDDRHLRALGRIHNSGDIERAVEELRSAGFDNFNLDLMYALPEQRIEQAVADVRRTVSLEPTHISHYQLTLEPGTVFFHRPPPLPDQDASWEMQQACQAVLAEHGYEQYEVSAYARAGSQCKHNLNYWQFGDYIGIGAGAHGKLTDGERGQVVRTVKHRQPREYLRQRGRARAIERRVVAADELAFEFMLNALRLRSGFSAAQFSARTGLGLDMIREPLERAVAQRLLIQEGDRWWPTERGYLFLNDLQALFLPDHEHGRVLPQTPTDFPAQVSERPRKVD
ncbi:MAG TPA: radical SAM family heme chaperone HemW [Steroidobacteraceae bacterium]